MDIRKRIKNVAIGASIVAMVAFPCIARAEQPLNHVPEQHQITQVYNAKHIYKTPLFNINSDNKVAIENAETNCKKIEGIVNDFVKMTNMCEVKMVWIDDNPSLDEKIGPSFSVTQNMEAKDTEFSIISHSSVGNLLDNDEIACSVAHELGHVLNGTDIAQINMQRLTGEDYSVLWSPYEEAMADKASVAIASKGGYDVTKFKSGMEKVIYEQSAFCNKIYDRYEIAGQESYPCFVNGYPSYSARMLQYEAFIKEYQQNPDKFYNEVLHPDNFSMTKVQWDLKSSEFFNEIQNQAKAKLSEKDYNEVLSTSKNKKEFVEKLIVKELDKVYQKQFGFEKQANNDFFKYVDSLDKSQLQRVFKGMTWAHDSEISRANERSEQVKSKVLEGAIRKRYEATNEIFTERVNYVMSRMRQKGLNVDYEVQPIEFNKSSAVKDVVVERNVKNNNRQFER